MKAFKKIQSAVLILGATTSLVGCGSSPTPAPVNQTVQQLPGGNGLCPVGMVMSPYGGCVVSTTPLMGSPSCFLTGEVTDSANRKLKKYTCHPLMGLSAVAFQPARRLGPNDPSGPYSYTTNTRVRPGDRVTFSGSGGYNYATSAIYLLTNCTKYSIGGSDGLFASDGTTTYPLGTSANLTIQNDGMLRIGVNGVPSNATASCMNMTVSQFQVLHCEDSSGTTYPCP